MDNKIDKDSYVYKKYLKKYDKDAPENIIKKKQEKSEKRREWWKNNWIGFGSLVVTILALLVATCSLVVAILTLMA